MFRHRRAFTLIELLIVIAIIGILIAAIAVAVTKAKELANSNDQKNNMKNLGTACLVAEQTNSGRLPPAKGLYGPPVFNPADGAYVQRQLNVFTHLLPFLDNKPAYDAIVTKNPEIGAKKIRVFLSVLDPSLPADPTRYTSFAANIRAFSMSAAYEPYNAPINMTTVAADDGGVPGTGFFVDGASNVILFGTKYAVCNGFGNFLHEGPSSNNTTSATPHRAPFFGAGPYDPALVPSARVGTTNPPYQVAPSLAPSGDNVCNNTIGVFGHSFGGRPMAAAMGDTSVRDLSFTITGETFMRALSPNDGQALGADW